jgi:hypothetical protein
MRLTRRVPKMAGAIYHRSLISNRVIAEKQEANAKRDAK